MGFNTFRGDNRTFAVILLVPAADRELRVLRHEPAWQAACAAITPLDVMTSDDYARPIIAHSVRVAGATLPPAMATPYLN